MIVRTMTPLLHQWKNQSGREALLLCGARHVGKSSLLEAFGRENFLSVITCNFEIHPELGTIFEHPDPRSICASLEVVFKTRLIPGKSLLFLDEIQNCPKAVAALRSFRQRLPELHLVAASSFLETLLRDSRFVFPVGDVKFLYLKPLSFYEFLQSQNQNFLVEMLHGVTLHSPIPHSFHLELLRHLREYFAIGGMPSAVRCFQETGSLLEVHKVFAALQESYRSDFFRHAAPKEHKTLLQCYEKVPHLIGRPFKYVHIGTEHRPAALKVALEQLGWAGLLQKVLASSSDEVIRENKFRLLFLDGALASLGDRHEWNADLLKRRAGALGVQFTGQELLAYADPHRNAQLLYWERNKKGALAEADYLVQSGSEVFPCEVRGGALGSLKSLGQFIFERKAPFGIRISEHPLSFQNQILSIPLYLISQLHRLVAEV